MSQGTAFPMANTDNPPWQPLQEAKPQLSLLQKQHSGQLVPSHERGPNAMRILTLPGAHLVLHCAPKNRQTYTHKQCHTWFFASSLFISYHLFFKEFSPKASIFSLADL